MTDNYEQLVNEGPPVPDERHSHCSTVVAEILQNLIIIELSDLLVIVIILTIICKYHGYEDDVAVDVI